jgi:hypothetical protein
MSKAKPPAPLQHTIFGFEWGPLIVERCTENAGHVVVMLKTSKGALEVAISPRGVIETAWQPMGRDKPYARKRCE